MLKSLTWRLTTKQNPNKAFSHFLAFAILSLAFSSEKRKWLRSKKHHQAIPKPERKFSGPSVLSATRLTKELVTSKVNTFSISLFRLYLNLSFRIFFFGNFVYLYLCIFYLFIGSDNNVFVYTFIFCICECIFFFCRCRSWDTLFVWIDPFDLSGLR